MRKILTYTSWINILGFFTATLSLMVFVFFKHLAWGQLYLLVNLLIGIPFVISGITILKNIENPDEKKIQNTLITVFLVLFIPSLVLPFTYELGGLTICLSVFGIGYWSIISTKDIWNKMIILNALGFLFLLFTLIFIFQLIKYES